MTSKFMYQMIVEVMKAKCNGLALKTLIGINSESKDTKLGVGRSSRPFLLGC